MTPQSVLGERHGSRVQIDANGCWIWTGSRNQGGYGQARVNGKLTRVHQAAFAAARGTVPDGLEIDHVCRIPACCNPEHLEAVTHAENIRRGSQDRKRPEPKTHCSEGHELTPENRIASNTRLGQCRTCYNANRRKHDARRREEERAAYMVGVLADAPEATSDDDDPDDEDEAADEDTA